MLWPTLPNGSRSLTVASPHISIWSFCDAPEEYRALSCHGGDEDFVTHIPAELVEDYREWTDEYYGTPKYELSLKVGLYPLEDLITRLGVCDTSYHRLPNGDFIAIGAHA